ncbi:MAG: efflux RND transporter periplasmic adaptor subunit [Planctomycetales bacterium]|nr:efflux RND transporter periplasmic adaptor subunit [Planctomycetales bacterium]
MRFWLRLTLIFAVLGGLVWAAKQPVSAYLKKRHWPQYREDELSLGTIRSSVSTTGKIEPKLKVHIGSFVSGPITELNADFNSEVKKDELLARIDTRIYDAGVMRDEASLATARAEVTRVEALLHQARNNERRGLALFEEDEDYISDVELDSLRFNREALEAQLSLTKASVQQAEAILQNSRANLDYTQIRSPVDGIVIDRKIDPGQTLASQFQTPELFVVGVGMREEMYIYASVDETDIGLIRKAQEMNQPVSFQVEAYRDELFTGHIKEIRLSSTETQTVVTYPVVVSVPNDEFKLLPGMTAKLTFQIEEHVDVLRVPWAALRFFPTQPQYVVESDRPLLEGRQRENEKSEETKNSAESPTVDERVAARKRQRRHVWKLDGEMLRAVEVELGVSDYRYAEVLSGELKAGDKVVVGTKSK